MKERRRRRRKKAEPTYEATAHVLVPKHEILTEEELQQLYIKYNIQSPDLPVIYLKDPALREHEVKIGDVIKITRSSPTAGTTVYYRRVSHE